MTIVLGAAGALIGSAFGGPAGARLGWSIGTTIGSYMDMQGSLPKQETGKLSDLRFSGSAYGATLPMIWGKTRVGGNVIWVAEDEDGNHLVEHKRNRSVGSKKSKTSVTEYWYTSTFAVGFCIGTLWMPDDSTVYRAPVIKRIWANDILIFDADATENIIIPTRYSGSESQTADPTIVAAEGVASTEVNAFRGICYAVFEDTDLSDFGNQIPNFSVEIETASVVVGDIYSDLIRMCGLDTSDIDVSGATDSVDGYAIVSLGSIQAMVDPLLLAYAYDQVEVDGKLKLVKRGGATSFALTADDLGAKIGGTGNGPYTRKRRVTTDLPGRVEVRYFDVDGDYQQALEGESRQTADQSRVITFDLPVSITADDAREIAARELDRSWFEDETLETSVLHRFCTIAPGDVGTISTSLGTKRVRVLQVSGALAGEVRLMLVPDDANVGTQNTGGIGGGSGGDGGVVTIVPTNCVVWSGREVVDAHEAYPGFYVAASGGPGWRGCTVYYSLDNGVTWIQGSSISGRGIFGEALTVLPDA